MSVARIEREPCAAAGSYEAYVVSATLTDGRQLRLFLKDYGASRRPRRDARARRERELGVYRELLPEAGLGTARHLGEVWDDERRWLLLELVEGRSLRDLGLEHWISPLEWLGRLHARFADAWDGSAPPPFLERHDEPYFRAMADRAMTAVASLTPWLAERMATVRERLHGVLPVLAAGPRTLVHGAFLPANVIVAPGKPQRICVVDWELAAVGAPCYDLAFFCDGFEGPALDRMLAAYRDAAEANGLCLPDDARLRRAIDCFRLQRVMGWLEAAERKRYTDEAIDRLVTRGEMLSALVEA